MKNLIIFEGIDGSGKTSQCNYLKDYIESKFGKKCYIVREPGGCEQSEIYRTILKSNNKLDPYTQLVLFCTARYFVIENVILPILNRNEIVIMDRFIFSTIAYQCYGGGLSCQQFKDCTIKICPKAIQLNKSALNIYIDIPVDTALSRIQTRGIDSKDPFENKDFLEKVKNGYDIIFGNSENCVKINGNNTKECVFNEICKNIQ